MNIWPLKCVGVCCIAAVLVLAMPASADKVGVAAAVNPDAFSSLSGTPNKQLNIGKSIFYNERINTTASGLVQVLLVDGSTFTVGPNSDLVIDKFVYDPRKKTGEMVATFSKGTMRFIGGKLSKNDGGVKVKTPSGSLAIRGGMVQGSVQGYSALFSFLFGDSMTFTGNNGQTETVYETGYTLDLSGGTPTIRPTTPKDTSAIMQALGGGDRATGNSTATNDGGSIGPGGAFQAANGEDSNTDQLISDANIVMIQTEILNELAKQHTSPPPESQNNGGTPANTPTAPPDSGPITPPDNGPTTPTPITYSYGGYSTGIILSDHPQQNFTNIVSSSEPTDVLATRDSQGNVVSAVSVFRDVTDNDPATSAYILGMNLLNPGDFDPLDPDLDNFAVDARVLNQGGIKYSNVQAFGFSVDGDKYGLTALFPETFGQGQGGKPPAFCTDCDFFRWGTTAAKVRFSQGSGTQYEDVLTAGWWISGDVTTIGQLPQTGSATYAGHTIGTVVEKAYYGDSSAWSTRLAAGDVQMKWNFADRAGTLDIRNFDANGTYGAVNVSGAMEMPGQLSKINKFSGPLSGSLGQEAIAGGAVGSFARRGTDPAGGVIGNWHVKNNDYYKATGIFGAGRTPNNPIQGPQ